MGLMAAKRIPIPEPAVTYFNGQYPDKRKIERGQWRKQ
jgi:hypothetical protein